MVIVSKKGAPIIIPLSLTLKARARGMVSRETEKDRILFYSICYHGKKIKETVYNNDPYIGKFQQSMEAKS